MTFYHDPLREKTIAATPEETVRQIWIHRMISFLGYPRGFVMSEKRIDPSLTSSHGSTKRRIDLIVYSQQLSPLLLLECKAEKLSEKALNQVLGYNEAIKAPFVAVATQDHIVVLQKDIHYSYLPTYQELLAWSQK